MIKKKTKTMTKKDCDAIAAAIYNGTVVFPNAPNSSVACRYEAFMAGADDQVKQIVRRLADIFAADIPRFDRERFFKACGIE